MNDIIIWCRNEKCKHYGMIGATDSKGLYGMCNLGEITITKDGKCEEMDNGK
jgi:hypothetical protein